MKICPICKERKLKIDFLSTFPKHLNRDGDYIAYCISSDNNPSSCNYWERYENYKIVKTSKDL